MNLTKPIGNVLLESSQKEQLLPAFDMPDHGVDLWWIPVPDIPVQAFYACYGDILSKDEQQRFTTQRLRKGQLQFLLTRIALRHLLSAYHVDTHPSQWRFSKSATGRPSVDRSQSHLEFNLTHTGNLLLIAFTAQGEPGVDAEVSGRSVDAAQVAQRFFSASEFRDISDADAEYQTELFLRYWTLKEAAVKATGQGLARALRRFCFTNPQNEFFRFTDTQTGIGHDLDQFCFWSTIFEQCAIGLCLKCKADTNGANVKITSRQISWPLTPTDAKVSELAIDWNKSS
ncbi:MAG: 4'-phosphopantetheinyl transferase superfamily protein [Pseudohongiella sp.]|nr:4'-phosphopantetheinyl transferase superfamily protein [Pseudohongiella sp.]